MRLRGARRSAQGRQAGEAKPENSGKGLLPQGLGATEASWGRAAGLGLQGRLTGPLQPPAGAGVATREGVGGWSCVAREGSGLPPGAAGASRQPPATCRPDGAQDGARPQASRYCSPEGQQQQAGRLAGRHERHWGHVVCGKSAEGGGGRGGRPAHSQQGTAARRHAPHEATAAAGTASVTLAWRNKTPRKAATPGTDRLSSTTRLTGSDSTAVAASAMTATAARVRQAGTRACVCGGRKQDRAWKRGGAPCAALDADKGARWRATERGRSRAALCRPRPRGKGAERKRCPRHGGLGAPAAAVTGMSHSR